MHQPPKVHIRIATPQDAAALVDIYAPYVEKTAITFAYTVPTVEAFAAHLQKTQEKYPYLVAETQHGVVGYAYVGPFHARAAYDWAVETSIYVKESCKGAGIGGKLYRALEDVLAMQNILNVNACIAYTDTPDVHLTQDSVRFHEHFGYRMVGQFQQCGYKFDHWYDMVWMEKHIGPHPVHPPRVKPFPEIWELVQQRYPGK